VVGVLSERERAVPPGDGVDAEDGRGSRTGRASTVHGCGYHC